MIELDVQNLLIRADAGVEVGTGHVMRCLALAQAWQDIGGNVVLTYASLPSSLVERLLDEGLQVVNLKTQIGVQEDVIKTLDVAREYNVEWIIADGYLFGAEYQLTIKMAGYKLLLIDDFGHASHYFSDIVINQNLSADESLYISREPETSLLLGTRYVLLRREFFPWRKWHRKVRDTASNILIMMGGSDFNNVTSTILNSLKNLDISHLNIKVIVGASNPHSEMLGEVISADPAIKLVLDPTNIPELMAWADLAVSAGGSTSWELAFMGVPNFTVVVADNQLQISDALHDHGASVNLGRFDEIRSDQLEKYVRILISTIDKRKMMSKLSQELVDGCGAIRVVKKLSHNDQLIFWKFQT